MDGEIVWPLSPLSLVPEIEPTSDSLLAPAVQLFVERAWATAPLLTFHPAQLEQVGEIWHSLDGLPLAIELAAARTRSFSLAEIATQVRTDPSRLARLHDISGPFAVEVPLA
jgi:predicted ATPase